MLAALDLIDETLAVELSGDALSADATATGEWLTHLGFPINV